MTDKPHKLAAIVFTDIVGYTKQMEKNEERTMQLLQKQREIIFPIVESHGGEIIKEIGDGLLMMFNSAIEAVRCTINIQTRLKDEELTIRAGIHIGDVIFREGDVFGSAVNTAARIEPLAQPNGICISEDVRNQVKNKDDIRTVSLGEKKLKGVGETVEVFRVVLGDAAKESSEERIPFLKDLWQRRVIQILGLYIITAVLIRFVVSSLVSSLVLSPHLVSLTWIILISLIPTVGLIAYFHGKSKEKWNRIETIGLPLNMLFTILLVVFLFKGKDLGAATENLVLEDEEGKKIERIVSKSEFRKKIAIFFYENKSEDTSLFWLQYAVPTILDYDLSQNMFIQAHAGTEYMYKFKDAGYNKGVGAPWMLLKNIAGFYNLNYFVTGSFDLIGEQFKVITKLYETESGKLISEFEIENQNFFKIIDNISINLYNTLELPSYQSEESKDLPISEIYTASLKATEYYTKGNIEIILNHNWNTAIEYTEQAIKEDPGFAIAHLMLAEYYFTNSKMDEAEGALQKAMDNIYVLPERKQFYAKFFYYILKQEPDKAMAVLKMLTELYPEDIEAHEILATRYQYKNMLAESIEEYRTILALDPDQAKYIRYIGDLYEALGNYDSSLFYHNLYTELHPKDFKAYRNLGELYLNMADFELAAENLDKALVIEPGDIDVLLTRIIVDLRLGKFENSEERYLNLLKTCTTINDSSEVYDALSDYFDLKGQPQKSLYYYQKFIRGVEKFLNPLSYMVYNLFSLDKYVLAGQVDKAYQIIKENEIKFQPPIDKVVAFGYMFYYIEVDSAENAEKYVQEAKDLAIGFGEEILLANVYFAEGRIFELKNEYEKALESYMKYQQNRPLEISTYRLIAKCHRKLGNLDKAEENILTALKHKPSYPKNNYEAALLYLEKGDSEKAKEHLQQALEVWKDADEGYEPAKLAREKLNELEAS